MTNILSWLQAQLAALIPTVKALVANSSQPARTTLTSAIILLGVAWLILQILGALKK